MADKIINRTGVVVSDKMNKTIIVQTTRMVTHPLYKKRVRKTRRYMVHDEHEVANVGDVVEFIDCMPISKHCHWRLLKVTQKASEAVEVSK